MTDNPLGWVLKDPHESKFRKHSDRMIKMLKEEQKIDKPHLYQYQIAAVRKTKAVILGDEAKSLEDEETGIESETRPVLIVAPTGSGKSGMIVLLPYVLNSNKVLVLTPSKVISDQISTAFGHRKDRKCFFETVGLIKNDKDDIIKNLLEEVKIIQGPNDIKERLGNLVIVNAQKFGGKAKLSLVYKNEAIIKDVEAFFREFDTLIVDEAHHYPANTWLQIVEEFSKPVPNKTKKIIFLTATPKKIINGKEEFILGGGKEALARIAYVITPNMVEGITTRKCKFWEPDHDGQATNVFRDLQKLFKENSKLEPRITPKAMILVRTKSEAKDLVNDLNELSGQSDFSIPILAENSESLDKFTNGNFQVGVTCGVGKEGYDNADVVVCVILRKIQKGIILFNQFVGRCMRLKRGLEGELPDQSVGMVLSYPEFCQKKLWDEREKVIAEDDPIEVDEAED